VARILVAVPFYVDRPAGDPRQPDDALFDHPTPLGGVPTLPRLLRSLERLDGAFELVVVVAWSHPELTLGAQAWAEELVTRWAARSGTRVWIAGHDLWDPADPLLAPTHYSADSIRQSLRKPARMAHRASIERGVVTRLEAAAVVRLAPGDAGV